MSKADFVRYKSDIKIYRCINCKKEFEMWGNAFFCCQGCADQYNACDGCGRNKNFDCRCNEDEY